MAAEVMHEYTADKKRYYRLLSEMKYELDHYNRMAEAEERGIQIGEARGRAAEREKAEAEKLAERAAMETAQAAERAAAVDALRTAGVPEEIIREAYKDAGREDS
jgi:predicted transposase YdaD